LKEAADVFAADAVRYGIRIVGSRRLEIRDSIRRMEMDVAKRNVGDETTELHTKS
jgi:hypothetical protein